MAKSSSEVVVIGAGIIGCSVAYNLARAGLEVTVVDRRGVAAEASGANLGLVTTITKEPGTLLFDLLRESLVLFSGLAQELGEDVEFQRVGSIRMLLTEKELREGSALVARQRAVGLDVRMVDPEEARALEPALPSQLLGAAYCPFDGFVNPLALTTAYARAATRLGARLLCPATVTGIELRGGAVSAVETDRETVSTRTVVNAAGPWAGEIGRFVGTEVPVVPCRGQVLVTARLPRLINMVIYGPEPYALQTKSGTVLIGSTTEFVGFDKSTDLATIREFAEGIAHLFPFLRDAHVVRTWAGLRPATSDGMPLLGRVDGVEGFVNAAGHFRNGVGCGPATGRIIAKMLSGATA